MRKYNLMIQLLEFVTNEVTKKGEGFHIEYRNNVHFEEGLEPDIITMEELLYFISSLEKYERFEIYTFDDYISVEFTYSIHNYSFKLFSKGDDNVVSYSDYLKEGLKELDMTGSTLYRRTKPGVSYPMWKGDYDVKTREEFIEDLSNKDNLLNFIMFGNRENNINRFFIKFTNNDNEFKYDIEIERENENA